MEILEQEKQITTSCYTMWLENGMIYAEFEPHTALNIELTKEFIKDSRILMAGHLLPIIVNTDHIYSSSHDEVLVFNHLIDNSSSICKAFVGTSEKGKILAKVISNLGSGFLPSKSFDSTLKANNWINNYRLYAA